MRFFATRLNGDGTEGMISSDLPLSDWSITQVVSGADTVEGSVKPEILSLKADDGSPLLQPWSTAIYAEEKGDIVAGGIVQPGTTAKGSVMSVDAAGFSAYPDGQGYDGAQDFIEADTLDIYRHIWNHLQTHPRGNIGMRLGAEKSGVLIGEELEEVEFEAEGEQVAFDRGPFRLAWWLATDLGERIGDLLEAGGFEYREQHSWRERGDGIDHQIRFGVPRIGRRRQDIHFMLGDNLVTEPTYALEDYASEVVMLGAGEGRTSRVGRAARSGETRLRRHVVLSDRSLDNMALARNGAAVELGQRTGRVYPTQISVRGSLHDGTLPEPGDEVLLKTHKQGWYAREEGLWVRASTVRTSAGSSVATCDVLPVD